MDIDPITGLPRELGSFEHIAQEEQEITVSIMPKKFNKVSTIITGFGKGTDIKDIAKKLKNKFACGGTFKEGRVELQGDYRPKMRDALIELGFSTNNIKIKY